MARALNYYAPPPGDSDERDRLQELRVDVADTVGLMGDNIHKALLRGFKLEELEHRSEHLEVEAQQFRKTTKKVKLKFWRRDKKMTLILAVMAMAVLVIITLIITLSLRPWEHNHGSNPADGGVSDVTHGLDGDNQIATDNINNSNAAPGETEKSASSVEASSDNKGKTGNDNLDSHNEAYIPPDSTSKRTNGRQ